MLKKIFGGLAVAALFALAGLVLSQVIGTQTIADGAEPRVYNGGLLTSGDDEGDDAQPEYVVRVRAKAVERPGYVEVHAGTGTVIREDLILTANHVVRDLGAKKMQRDIIDIVFKDGTEIKATVLAFDVDLDAALLQLSAPTKVTPAKIAESTPEEGDLVHIGGFPGHGLVPGIDGYYEVEGKVAGTSAVSRFAKRDEFLIINARTFSGMSGAGGFNEADELVGVMWGSLARARMLDTQALKEFLDRTEFADVAAPDPEVKVFGGGNR